MSEPLRLLTKKRRTWLKDIETFVNAIVEGSGPSNIMNLMRVPASRYYSHLRAASNALLNYNNFHIIKLMKASNAPEKLRIYTDCIVCSIKLDRDVERYQTMKIIVSTCVQNNRALILAFHPLFDQQKIDDNTVTNDDDQPLEQRRLDYLIHPLKIPIDDPIEFLKNVSSGKKRDLMPQRGVDGYPIEEFYAYLGHFLVLRKLLAKVPLLQFYMDGEAALYNAALNAFSDRIKDKSCDVVVRKMEKNKSGNQSRTRNVLNRKQNRVRYDAKRAYKQAYPDSKSPSDQELRRFLLNEEMKAVNKAIEEKSTNENGIFFPEPLSKIYKTAISRATGKGKVFWVNDILTDKYTPEGRMLWLTRSAERSNTDYELDLYVNGSLFYIDSVFGAFRHRSSLAGRPLSTATGHKSYNRNPEKPKNLIMDFTINVAFWNFFLKYRSKQKNTIAYAHGLINKQGSPEIKVAFRDKYTFSNAKRMSKWLGI